MRLPTIDAWNLSIQRSITPTLSVTMAYVGNKGTHTLSAGDGNNTNPNEAAIFLPAQYSIEGRALHYTTSTAEGAATPDQWASIPTEARTTRRCCSVTTAARLLPARIPTTSGPRSGPSCRSLRLEYQHPVQRRRPGHPLQCPADQCGEAVDQGSDVQLRTMRGSAPSTSGTLMPPGSSGHKKAVMIPSVNSRFRPMAPTSCPSAAMRVRLERPWVSR